MPNQPRLPVRPGAQEHPVGDAQPREPVAEEGRGLRSPDVRKPGSADAMTSLSSGMSPTSSPEIGEAAVELRGAHREDEGALKRARKGDEHVDLQVPQRAAERVEIEEDQAHFEVVLDVRDREAHADGGHVGLT